MINKKFRIATARVEYLQSLPRISLCTKTLFPSFIKRPNVLSISETIKYRIRIYATPYKMMNYVDSHLKEVPISQRISYTYPVCQSEGLVLKYLQHFKNHMQTVHGISLRL
ncbi:hypothetical protein CJF31_00009119 [Rutstroemia sp. NJR-2017a BVV2]|nr:hypothetical protein CJF31_00009119 [Rutstroemia sp. NJR-2017a BVV2]